LFPIRMEFAITLIRWYSDNHRSLPWRETNDPYKVWISEVILQQTRVGQGLSYYLDFVEKFPDVFTLAAASEQQVIKAWQGLGYYSRARNLHHSAQVIVEDYGGKFPSSYSEIIRLKGIGDYTASAIASISFGQSYPVIDGNVIRFLSRLKGLSEPANSGRGKKIIKDILDKEIDRQNPGTFNQALMEFGALQCIPGNPLCIQCPFMESCVAYRTGTVDKFPVKEKKAPQKIRHFHYLVHILNEDNQLFTFLNRRKEKDIWRNMFEFPMLEKERLYEWDELRSLPEIRKIWPGKLPVLVKSSETIRHVLSHRIILARYFVLEGGQAPGGFIRVKFSDIDNFPVPRLVEKIMEHSNITFRSNND